jgi:imidazolonepropionase-like amidohydrolase
MVKTAHSLKVKVAAHCVNGETIKMLLEAGVDTLEHGAEMTEDVLPLLVEKQAPWTPTFAAYYSHQYPGARPWWSLQKVFSKAIQMGAAITTGGDTGENNEQIPTSLLTSSIQVYSHTGRIALN